MQLLRRVPAAILLLCASGQAVAQPAEPPAPASAPLYLVPPHPAYPLAALRDGIEGRCEVRFGKGGDADEKGVIGILAALALRAGFALAAPFAVTAQEPAAALVIKDEGHRFSKAENE
jgi:hypothetical protein